MRQFEYKGLSDEYDATLDFSQTDSNIDVWNTGIIRQLKISFGEATFLNPHHESFIGGLEGSLI